MLTQSEYDRVGFDDRDPATASFRDHYRFSSRCTVRQAIAAGWHPEDAFAVVEAWIATADVSVEAVAYNVDDLRCELAEVAW